MSGRSSSAAELVSRNRAGVLRMPCLHVGKRVRNHSELLLDDIQACPFDCASERDD